MTLHVTDLTNDTDIRRGVDVSLPFSATNKIYRNYLKRAIDIVAVLILAPIVGPLIALIAFVVSLDGSNPFYSQLRVGKDGRHFRLWKIRTMTRDADEKLESYLQSDEQARAEWDLHQKLKFDPRITVVGKFLRKASLDELPQLLNVFGGSMSLVGPRPMMLDQETFYHGSAYYRLSPGITGLWQISDRNACSFVSRVKFDEKYDQTLSFKTDFLTLLRTVMVVLRGTGY